jgi:hypothetical protein
MISASGSVAGPEPGPHHSDGAETGTVKRCGSVSGSDSDCPHPTHFQISIHVYHRHFLKMTQY